MAAPASCRVACRGVPADPGSPANWWRSAGARLSNNSAIIPPVNAKPMQRRALGMRPVKPGLRQPARSSPPAAGTRTIRPCSMAAWPCRPWAIRMTDDLSGFELRLLQELGFRSGSRGLRLTEPRPTSPRCLAQNRAGGLAGGGRAIQGWSPCRPFCRPGLASGRGAERPEPRLTAFFLERHVFWPHNKPACLPRGRDLWKRCSAWINKRTAARTAVHPLESAHGKTQQRRSAGGGQ